MVNWNYLRSATSPDAKPTPGWLVHEICMDAKMNPKDCPDIAEFLMQCLCSDQLNIQLKAAICIKHLAAEVLTFQTYMQSCVGALKILEDISAPPFVAQTRAIEPQEVRTVRDATAGALTAIKTPHTVEQQTEAAGLKERIQGFGNYEPPPEEPISKTHGVSGQVQEFVADSINEVVDDFREKGAVGAVKDATIDALDMVLDGVDTVWGWVLGKKDSDMPRICNPGSGMSGTPGMGPQSYAQSPGAFGAPYQQQSPGAFTPGGFAPQPFVPQVESKPASASNHYAAAFGSGVVGANNPIMIDRTVPTIGSGMTPTPAPVVAAPARVEQKVEEPKPKPAPMVDLLHWMILLRQRPPAFRQQLWLTYSEMTLATLQ